MDLSTDFIIMLKWFSENGLTAVLAVCAIVITVVVVNRELTPLSTPPARQVIVVSNWQAYSTGGTLLGPSDAPVKIVVFSDYQCPFCRALNETLRRLRTRMGDSLSVRVRQFPLKGIHPYAMAAAEAATCAAAQGRFEAYNDSLFANQADFGPQEWSRLAQRVGLPGLAKFVECQRGHATDGEIDADVAAGYRIPVTGTPTLLINGRVLSGAPPYEAVLAMVTSTLDSLQR